MYACMTMIDSSSAAESSMEDGGSNVHNNRTLTKHRPRTANKAATTTATHRHGGSFGASEIIGKGEKQSVRDCEADDDEEAEGDPEVWDTLNKSFRQVQSVLDRNRVLIQQVNENHRSKIPDNLVKNVALIQEINANISKVVSVYSDLSSDFSSMVHQRNEGAGVEKNGDGKREDGAVQLNDTSLRRIAGQLIFHSKHRRIEGDAG